MVAALFFSLYFYGCAPRSNGLLTSASLDVDQVLGSLKQRENNLKSFRGVGRFKTVRGPGVKVSRVAWIGSKPQSLRVETLGPWGQPTLTFIVNKSSFLLHSRQDNQYFKGEATPRTLSRFVSIPLRGEDLFTLLSGQPPILPFHHGKIRPLASDGGCLLSLYEKWGRLVEKIWLKNGEIVEQVEVFDTWGDLQYRVAFSEFRQTESFWLPHTMAISDNEGPVCSLTLERFWANVSIPAGAFTLEVSGIPVKDLDS